jgi:excisionase family DNA binding protein
VEQRGLFVRLPAAAADKLDRASFELKTPKRQLVANLVEHHLGDQIVGRAATSRSECEVLTLEQLAGLLQVTEETALSLAERGELPGRTLGAEWRFSRQAVLDWLAAPEQRSRTAGFGG